MALVALILVYPFFKGVLALNVLLTTVLLTALYAVGYGRQRWWVAVALGVPYILSLWFVVLGYSEEVVVLAGLGFGILFLGYTAGTILQHVMHRRQVDADLLYGAVASYLLIGIAWALLYSLLEWIQPGSFQHTASDDLAWDDFLYYSFVTLTTLGYGDLTPLSAHVRSFAMLEAITGVFYVAILVARLVGLHLVQSVATSQRE